MPFSMSLFDEVARIEFEFGKLCTELGRVESNIITTRAQLEKIQAERDLVERGVVALSDAKGLLAESSLRECIDLGNSAIRSIFGFDDVTVEWDDEGGRFVLNRGDFRSDLSTDEGGGIVTVISFVFTVYLMCKLGRRRFMAYDEAFTQVSTAYFPAFIGFVRKICNDLQIDLLLISHDARIELGDVDTAYRIEGGVAIKLK